MQISDGQAPAPAAAAPKEEVRHVADEKAARAEPRLGERFRDTLRRRRRGAGDGDGEGRDAATAAAATMTGWFRHEATGATGAAQPSQPVKATGPAAVGAARAVDRVLIGSGPEGAQARIRIGAGALAGTEIQLASSGAGNTVEARLLTHAASSRQTLAVALDEIRSRLQAKGIVLSARAPEGAARTRAPDGADDAGPWSQRQGAPGERR